MLLFAARAACASPSAQCAVGSHMPRPFSSAVRYKKCARATSCDTSPVVWMRIRSSRMLPAFLRARNELVDLAMELRAREQAPFDHSLELALQHVEFPAVDDDLVHLRPAGGVELAARQRNEGAAGLEPGLAAHHLARGGAADGDIGAAHHLLDRVLGHDRDAERLRPLGRERRARLRPARGATDFLELVHGREAAQGIGAHRADADEPENYWRLRIERADPPAGDGRRRRAADRIAPMLIDDANRLAATRDPTARCSACSRDRRPCCGRRRRSSCRRERRSRGGP